MRRGDVGPIVIGHAHVALTLLWLLMREGRGQHGRGAAVLTHLGWEGMYSWGESGGWVEAVEVRRLPRLHGE